MNEATRNMRQRWDELAKIALENQSTFLGVRNAG